MVKLLFAKDSYPTNIVDLDDTQLKKGNFKRLQIKSPYQSGDLIQVGEGTFAQISDRQRFKGIEFNPISTTIVYRK